VCAGTIAAHLKIIGHGEFTSARKAPSSGSATAARSRPCDPPGVRAGTVWSPTPAGTARGIDRGTGAPTRPGS
jgi:hypothetical protein